MTRTLTASDGANVSLASLNLCLARHGYSLSAPCDTCRADIVRLVDAAPLPSGAGEGVICPECRREAGEHGLERSFRICLKSAAQVLREALAASREDVDRLTRENALLRAGAPLPLPAPTTITAGTAYTPPPDIYTVRPTDAVLSAPLPVVREEDKRQALHDAIASVVGYYGSAHIYNAADALLEALAAHQKTEER